MSTSDEQMGLTELLKDAPKNWGRWGDDDELGSLNYLTSAEVLRGVRAVRQGKVFTLQAPICHPKGDPAFPTPSRVPSMHMMTVDKGVFLKGEGPDTPGGIQGADDFIAMPLQGSTQYDALGHVWYDDQMWNGYDAKSSMGGMSKASVLPIAERGVVGRGVFLDIARYRGKDHLDKGETFSHDDLLECAKAQGVTIERHDILVVRTGFIGSFYRRENDEFYSDFNEPGLVYSPELAEWFHDMEIPNLVTDTIANETTVHPPTGILLSLHAALMRNLGVTLTEIALLDDLGADCADDRQYDFLYCAAPLKVHQATGSPVNPVAVK